MSDSFTPEFERALTDGTTEFRKLDEGGSEGDMQMTARGVKHDDIMLFTEAMHTSYIDDLHTGDERVEYLAIASIIQLALFAGMSLERGRQEEERRVLDSPLPNWPES